MLGQQHGEPVSGMVPVANLLLGVLTVWVAHFDGSVRVWVAGDLPPDVVSAAQTARARWKVPPMFWVSGLGFISV